MNLEPSASTFSFSSAALAAPLKPVAIDRSAAVAVSALPAWTSTSTSADERRRTFGPVAVVLVSAALHVLLALSVSRARGHESLPLKLARHVRITVTRPPLPARPLDVPVTAPPPRPRPVPLVKKKLPLPEPPPEQPRLEAPPPPPPLLATTEATEPGAVIGSAQGSREGTGLVGGVKGETGVVAAPPPPPPPPPIAQAHEGAGYLRNPRPAYPEMARSRGWEGEVLLKVRVTSSGHAEAITVKHSSGRRLLDDAAIEAVRGWAFVPASQGGTAIPGWVEVPLVFKLQ